MRKIDARRFLWQRARVDFINPSIRMNGAYEILVISPLVHQGQSVDQVVIGFMRAYPKPDVDRFPF
jgi:hypothetical protein